MENNNFNANNYNQSDNEIEIVEIDQKNKNNRLPIILMVCVLAIALITGVLLVVLKTKDVTLTPTVNQTTTTQASDPLFEEFYSNALAEVITDESGSEISREEYITMIQQQIQDATTILNQHVGSQSPNEIEENTTKTHELNQDAGNQNSDKIENDTTKANSNNSSLSATTTVLNQHVGSQNPNKIEDDTTKTNVNANNTSQTETTTISPETLSKTDSLIKAFFNKTFFLKGALYSGGSGDPIHMAMNGDDFEVLTNIDGTELSFLRLNKKMYIKRAATKQYVSLTTAFFKLLGMDPDTLTFDMGDVNYDAIKNTAVISNVTINKKPGICYSFKNNDQSFKFYFENEDLRQIVIYDNNGSVTSEFSVDYFSATIPEDQLTIEGYKKTGIGTLFADLM